VLGASPEGCYRHLFPLLSYHESALGKKIRGGYRARYGDPCKDQNALIVLIFKIVHTDNSYSVKVFV